MKVNTNTMFMDGCAILVMVMCSNMGDIEFCDTKKALTTSAFIAELLAIDQANDLLCKLSCFSVWVSDAKLIVEALLSQTNLCEWHARQAFLRCRQRFQEKSWKLQWEPRQCNILVNRLTSVTNQWTIHSHSREPSAIKDQCQGSRVSITYPYGQQVVHT